MFKLLLEVMRMVAAHPAGEHRTNEGAAATRHGRGGYGRGQGAARNDHSSRGKSGTHIKQTADQASFGPAQSLC